MKARSLAIAAMAATICASGCSKTNQSPANQPAASITSAIGVPPVADAGQPASGADADAIRAAIEEHVRNDRSVDMDMLVMTVDSVSVSGNQARAQAAFRPKQGGTGMAMTYSLERQSGGWVVTQGQPSDAQFAHPPTDGVHSGMQQANPGEPPMPDVTDFLKNHPSTGKN
ncbi:MAG TPA: hypothetical protein VMD77_15710 [Candidatus Baltobacteraceae bacterium]|jgi:hypothetical protein|nr:hypothetical protein [Candidatus Baltobacteraceae bacterium]